LSLPLHLPVAIMVAAIMVASAHASSASPVYVPVGLSAGSNAGFVSPDADDKPSELIAMADFNRDGIADMVEAAPPGGKESRQHFLTIRLGQADGTFKSVPSHNLVGSDPRQVVVGDFNRDGNPDVIVADGDGALLEFLGDGSGNMGPAGNIAAFGSVASVAIGHFTNGGNLDLVVSDFRSNSAAILLGVGDGSFRLTWSFDLPKRGMEFHVATADFNKDGIADIVIMNDDNDNYEVMLGNGNGTFTYAPELSHLRDPYSYCPS
jgi:hypothetical protein